MTDGVTSIVIVGGGTAGWLAACRVAAAAQGRLDVTLVESPDIPTIGVGEGTWPTIRRTLSRIGIPEREFLSTCDASFKQGSRFVGWRGGGTDEVYFHPFVAPVDGSARALIAAWQASGHDFADAVGPQPRVCTRNLAPRQHGMPDYAGALNYAYHLDAVKLAALLRRHAVDRLGVRHVRDHVIDVAMADDGGIAAVRTRAGGDIAGDLFIDCTGHSAMLIGELCGASFIDRTDTLFNDRALAVQLPVAPDSAIASQTDATAHDAGWIWDIGLPTRRGIGCVYSSRYMDDDAAASVLTGYLRRIVPESEPLPAFRKLAFRSGHRDRFWVGNCLAIGLSAGFLEPLEASAIVTIELSLDALIDNFPAARGAMPVHADRFNALFRYRWDRIVEFLKLHYVLSERDTPYWRGHRDEASIPPRLLQLLRLWRDQPPSSFDFAAVDEVFPAASYQYVLYGMGFPPPPPGVMRVEDEAVVAKRLDEAARRARTLTASLPGNRAYLDTLNFASERPAAIEQHN